MKRSFLILISLVLISNLFSAGYYLSGTGSKAASLGGAFRAQADDYSAAFWNPAGLSWVEGKEFSLLGGMIYPAAEITLIDPEHGYRTTEVMMKTKMSLIPNLGFFTPLMEGKMRLGLSVFIPVGMGSFWDLYTLPLGYNDDVEFEEIDTYSDLKVIDIHPTFSYLLSEKLSIGVGVGYQIVLIEMGSVMLTPTGQTYPIDYLASFAEFSGGGYAISYNAGVLYKASEKLSLALTFNGGTALTLSGDASIDLYTPIALQLAQPTVFTDDIISSESLPEGDRPTFETELAMPIVIGAGVHTQLTDRLSLNADLSYTLWSQYKSLDITFTGKNPLGDDLEELSQAKNWKDTIRLAVGFSRALGESSYLNLGYFFETSPIPDESFDPLIPDTGLKHSLNLGFGYKFNENIGFVLNVENTFLPEKTVEEYSDPNEDGEWDNVPGKYELNVFSANAAFTYSF